MLIMVTLTVPDKKLRLRQAIMCPGSHARSKWLSDFTTQTQPRHHMPFLSHSTNSLLCVLIQLNQLPLTQRKSSVSGLIGLRATKASQFRFISYVPSTSLRATYPIDKLVSSASIQSLGLLERPHTIKWIYFSMLHSSLLFSFALWCTDCGY